jgi:transposase
MHEIMEVLEVKKNNRIPQIKLASKKGGTVRMYKYNDIYKEQNNPAWARKKIVDYALVYGQRATAKKFKCSRKTVKKWFDRKDLPEDIRYQNLSRKPKNSPNKISKELEDKIVECRKDKGLCSTNLKHQYDINLSSDTIYRALKRREADLGEDKIKPRKKKYQTKRDLRKIKKRYKVFESLQIDGKVLYDIPEFYPQYKHYDIPKVQWTIRDQKTGASFISYSNGETMLAALTFLVYFFEHLKRNMSVNIKRLKIQLKTDWGSYAVGNKHSWKESQFRKFIKKHYGIKHVLIKHKNSNSEVERFHGLVEDYFYKRVKLTSRQDLFKQATEHIIWFNHLRKNGYRDWKTPLQIMAQDKRRKIDPQVLALPAIDLDKHQDIYFYKNDPNYKPLTKESFFQDDLSILETMGYFESERKLGYAVKQKEVAPYVSDLDDLINLLVVNFKTKKMNQLIITSDKML